MLGNVFSKSIRDNRRAFLGWTAALTAVAAMYAGFWPSIGGNPELTKAMNGYPEALKKALNMQDLAQPENYLGSTVFGLLVPALVAVFAISYGVKAIAADEEAGTLDLVLAHPVGRVRLALQRFAAITFALVMISGVLCATMIALRGPAQYASVSPGRLAAISIQLALFGLCFAALAFSVGAATGRRALALGVAAGTAVLAYLANSFLPQVSGLEWTQRLSPFHWYLGGEPLKNGLQWGDSALMLAVTAILVAVGVLSFNRRDLTV